MRALQPTDLIQAAKDLAEAGKGKPRQAHLRRAVSTAYYAIFHCLAQACADMMIGGSGADRSQPAWRQVYRALEHGAAKSACQNSRVVKKFPKDIDDFASVFVELQGKRHLADYDPNVRYYKSSVKADISAAEDAIKQFTAVARKDRRAFAAHVLFRQRTS
ncbi:MAG: hypothetical protein KDA49_18190 [Rhodospirillaceae bacterium]|nr:hypothetical protein [Rhodospirillaceae bacterium]MCA8934416.1 hypothetical protein [Rhodospirillaceae bacterium]